MRSDGGVLVMLNCGEASEQLFARLDVITQWDRGSRTLHATGPAYVWCWRADPARSKRARRMKLLARPRKMPSMAGFGLQVTGYLEE